VLEESAGEEPLDDRGDDGAPRAVGGGEPLVVDQAQVPEAAVEQAIEGGCARPVDARGLGARRGANPMLVVCEERRRQGPVPLSEGDRMGAQGAGRVAGITRAGSFRRDAAGSRRWVRRTSTLR